MIAFSFLTGYRRISRSYCFAVCLYTISVLNFQCSSIPINLSEENLAQATLDERRRLRDLNETIRQKAREKQVHSNVILQLKRKIDDGEKSAGAKNGFLQVAAYPEQQENVEKQYEIEKYRARVKSWEFSFVVAEYEYMKAKIILKGHDDQDVLRFYRRTITDAYRALGAARRELQEHSNASN